MDLSALRRWWPVAGVVAILAVAALAAPRSALRITRVEPVFDDAPRLPEFSPTAAEPTTSAEPSTAAAANPAGLPDWVATAAIGLGVAAVVAVIGLLTYALIRNAARRRAAFRPAPAPGKPTPERTSQQVVAAVDAGLSELSDSDADPRRAVIGCWVRLEQTAAAAGTARQIGETSTDLVGRLLAAHQVSGDVLTTLARLYRQARYGTSTVDEGMRAEALAALRRLRGELSAGAAR